MRGSSPRRSTRRDHLRWLVGTSCLALVATGLASVGLPTDGRAAEAAKLYVFVNSVEKPHTLQKQLGAKMPRVDVTVFGRFRDFESALTNSPPDAVVALRPVLDELELAASIAGVIGGASDEPYALLSVDRPVSPQDVRTVGSVDLIGRDRMKDFVAKTMGRSSAPRVKLVTKTEDLLPLLQFGGAEAVLLPARHTSAIVHRSELTLVSTVLPTRVGLVAGAAVSTSGAAILDIIKSLDTTTSRSLGAETWQ